MLNKLIFAALFLTTNLIAGVSSSYHVEGKVMSFDSKFVILKTGHMNQRFPRALFKRYPNLKPGMNISFRAKNGGFRK